MGSFLQNVGNAITGTVGQDQYSRLSPYQGPDQNAYQIPGLQQYQQQSQQNANGMAQAPDLQGATAGTMGQQQALQQYLQQVAMGQGQTAADVALQQGQQMAARNLQSGMVSAGGMNPALQMRQLFNSQAANAGQLAGQSAQQKLQEQQQYGQMAQAGNQAIMQQQMAQTQQQFADQMQRSRAQQDIANNIFSASAQQTNYAVQADQNRQAYQMYMRQEQLQAMKDQARSNAAMIHGAMSGVGTLAGGAIGMGLGGPMGMMAGASMGGQFLGGLGGGGGGGGGFDPSMMAMMMRGGQQPIAGGLRPGSGGYVDPLLGDSATSGTLSNPFAGQ